MNWAHQCSTLNITLQTRSGAGQTDLNAAAWALRAPSAVPITSLPGSSARGTVMPPPVWRDRADLTHPGPSPHPTSGAGVFCLFFPGARDRPPGESRGHVLGQRFEAQGLRGGRAQGGMEGVPTNAR